MSNALAFRGFGGLFLSAAAGALSAFLFAVAMKHADQMLIVLAYISAFPIYASGFGNGPVGALVAAISSVACLAVATPSNIAVLHTFINAAPALMIAALAMRARPDQDGNLHWYPEGFLLTAATIYPLLIFLGIVAMTSSHPGGLLALTSDMIHAGLEPVQQQIDPEVLPMFTNMVEHLIRFMPALAATTWIIVNIMNAVMAQNLLRQQKWQIRTNFRLTLVEIPTPMIYAAAISGIIGLLMPAPFDYIGLNSCVVLVLPFVFVGLGVVQSYADTTRAPIMLMVGFYILLSVLIWFIVPVALLGMLDQWFHFRQKFQARMPVKEGEK